MKKKPWDGWRDEKPKNQTERKTMRRRCGKKCFLGPKLSYPVCKRKTCRVSKKGLWSAYIRGKQWSKAKRKRGSKALSKRQHQRVWKRAYSQIKSSRRR